MTSTKAFALLYFCINKGSDILFSHLCKVSGFSTPLSDKTAAALPVKAVTSIATDFSCEILINSSINSVLPVPASPVSIKKSF